ncbi:MAG: SDR family NAD(P)-dependent oxidoreductase [Gammaproteobacteria bacterium]|nr:SDR family NAD(P)-dependent oxidoreductase [Gammaproteobacteria bacterium]
MAKTMILTGASRGIGAATARAAAAAGMNLVLNARSADALETLASTLGENVSLVAGDVSDPEVCRSLVATARERFDGVHALINNAGILEPIGALDTVPGIEWEKNLRVNVLGPVLLSQAAIGELRRVRGTIINVSSGAAVKAVRGWSAYCTAKAALNHFTRMLAAEFAEVTSLAVSPGMTATDMQAEIRGRGKDRMPADEYRRFVDAYRAGQLRSPEAVARTLVRLSLEAPPDWSGEFITVDDPRIAALGGGT